MNISADDFLNLSVDISIGVLSLALIVVVYRLYKGPGLSDRVLALDVLVGLGIGFIAAIAIKTQQYIYVDIAFALGLVGFLATVAFARYVLHRGIAHAPPIQGKQTPLAIDNMENEDMQTMSYEASSQPMEETK